MVKDINQKNHYLCFYCKDSKNLIADADSENVWISETCCFPQALDFNLENKIKPPLSDAVSDPLLYYSNYFLCITI